MAKQLTFILGGARSGKSSYAEKLAAARGRQVLYVATATAWDEEMRVRIANHQAQRPVQWQTLEATHQLGPAITAACAERAPDLILIDCVTLLASNVLLALPEPLTEQSASAALLAEVDELLAAYRAGAATWVIVSNEVGLGVVPPYPLGRVYRDALGRANQRLAAAADEVIFMVSGLPMTVKTA
ncbi:MAG: bifunctional adenosylcobinamide kinase/adenosylcobinamide-phosphate guanylyltransferase [Caldilineaceae bacterium]